MNLEQAMNMSLDQGCSTRETILRFEHFHTISACLARQFLNDPFDFHPTNIDELSAVFGEKMSHLKFDIPGV